MIKTTPALFALIALTAGGCQTLHKTAPLAHKPPATQNDLAAAPVVTPPVLPTTPTSHVAVAPATTPASTAPASMPVGNYVAADADLATRLRNWPVSTNYYASGQAIAGPVYRIEAPPPRSNRWDDVYAEDLFQTLIITPVQMGATPVWALLVKPNTPIVYHGDTFPPSYNVDNPLPYYETETVPGMIRMKR
jgi:hypothetical protein